jgi:NTE family protein
MELSIQTMQRMITRIQMATFPPDVFIELPTDICGTMEFHRAREVAELGRARTSAVLDAIEN